jgi:hypothetical protein
MNNFGSVNSFLKMDYKNRVRCIVTLKVFDRLAKFYSGSIFCQAFQNLVRFTFGH